MASQPIVVRSSDGVGIAVWRSGSGPPLVLVHGTTADHTRWSRVSPLFEAHFTVHAIDRRGRGASGDAASYSISLEADDVAAVVDSIGGPVSLLGHSYGALCCLEAILRTSKMRRLVLYEPPIPTGREIVRAQTRAHIEAQLGRGEREAALLTFFREVVKVPEPELCILQTHPAWPGRVAAAHTLAREIRIESDYRFDPERFRAVHLPALLLLGGDSPPFFQQAVGQLKGALPGSRVLVMAGQQHIAMDTIPVEFVEIVQSFLSPMADEPMDNWTR